MRVSTEFTPVFADYVQHNHWGHDDDFNNRLYQLAKVDALKNVVTDPLNPLAVGDGEQKYSHLRHNFLLDTVDPVIPQFIDMVQHSVREFLLRGFGYEHEGDIHMNADPFYQSKKTGENIGIYTHTHPSFELVCTYYPHVATFEGQSENQMHNGAVRFYNPAMRGNRLWSSNPSYIHNKSRFSLLPKTGSMIVFEGHMPHDSTFFEAEDRMCIPVLCRLDLPNKHSTASMSEIMEVQNNGL
jgi:hypothetical protein